MRIAARNWLADATAVTWDGGGVVTGDMEALRRPYVGEPVAFTGTWIAFSLGASRRIRCVALPSTVQGVGAGLPMVVTVTVRSGGAAGTIVGSFNISVPTQFPESILRLPVNAAIDLTGDYIRFDLADVYLGKAFIRRLWASDIVDMRIARVTPALLDNSGGERSDGGVFAGTERRRRRQLKIDLDAATVEDALIRLQTASAIDSVLKIAAGFGNVGELLAIDPFLGDWWQFHGWLAVRPVIDRVAGKINRATLVLREF